MAKKNARKIEWKVFHLQLKIKELEEAADQERALRLKVQLLLFHLYIRTSCQFKLCVCVCVDVLLNYFYYLLLFNN